MVKRIGITAIVILFTLPFCGQEIVLLHTNDLHSHLNGFSPEVEYTPLTINDDATVGGFSRIASCIKQQKLRHKNKVITVDAGDFLMGTLFHSLEPTTGFQLSLMKKMGYDVVALGNHEFDFGPNTLCDIINHGLDRGPIPHLTLSNIKFSGNSANDDKLEAQYKAGRISRTKVIVKNGFKIGVFSLIGKDAEESAPGARPLTFTNYIRTARRMVKSLKNQNVDLIIALSHSGVEKDKNGTWTGEDVKLAEKVSGIDIIVSGHSHTSLKEPIKIKQTYIAQVGSYGTALGKIEISDIKTAPRFSFSQIPINDAIAGDAAIQREIDKQKELILSQVLQPMGLTYHQNIFETDFPLLLNRQNQIEKGNLGPFIADAILHETNTLKGGNTNIALIPAGMIRGNILPGNNGMQTTADLFSTLSLGTGNDSVPGYPLAQVFLNGKELKKIVEVLLIAYKTGTAKYIYYSGLRASYDPNKFLLNQIQSLEVKNEFDEFIPVDLDDEDTLYGLVGNSYLLSFVNLVKKMSFGVLQITPKHIDGKPIEQMHHATIDFDPLKPGVQESKEWISVINFSKTFSDIDNNGIPDMPIKYKEKINPIYLIESLPDEAIIVQE